jgi:lysophospholipase L1-like esterase
MNTKQFVLTLILGLLYFVGATAQKTTQGIKTFLCLGDSYTIGESVAVELRWSMQLAQALDTEQSTIKPTLIAKTGWTTDELLEGINQAVLDDSYDYVSLLIGVNNQYRGRSVASFEPEFTTLLNRAIALSKNKKDGVLVLSIPDWGVMPFAEGRDRKQIAYEIDAYNTRIEQICKTYGVRYFNITEISRQASENADLIANDGLHPSGAMYAAWVQAILPFFKLTQ